MVAQENDLNSYFLFHEFRDGTVFYKDGRRFNATLNYNIATKEFVFLDKSDNDNIKAFADKNSVTLVEVGDRIFLHDPKEVREVLQKEPAILVQYKAKIQEQGKNAGYGGTSETSAIDSYSGIHSKGIYYQFDQVNNLQLSRVDKTYTIVIDKKYKRFFNEKTFLKIFPKEKDPLKKYINENEIDFKSTNQIIELCNYAFSLP